MKKVILVVAVILCVIFIGDISWAFAQIPAAPTGTGPGTGVGTGPGTPIGGIAVAAAIGGGYALKKIRDMKKA